MVAEKKMLFKFSHYKSMGVPIISLWDFMTPWGVASLDPRDLIGRIYVGDH